MAGRMLRSGKAALPPNTGCGVSPSTVQWRVRLVLLVRNHCQASYGGGGNAWLAFENGTMV